MLALLTILICLAAQVLLCKMVADKYLQFQNKNSGYVFSLNTF
jgi:hypothetical protein